MILGLNGLTVLFLFLDAKLADVAEVGKTMKPYRLRRRISLTKCRDWRLKEKKKGEAVCVPRHFFIVILFLHRGHWYSLMS